MARGRATQSDKVMVHVYIVIHSARILYRSEPVSTCLPRAGRYGSTFPFVARPPLLSLISQPQLNSSLVNPTRN